MIVGSQSQESPSIMRMHLGGGGSKRYVTSNDTVNDTVNDTENVSDKKADTKIPTEMKVYVLLKEDPTQTREKLAEKTGRTVRTIQRALDKLSGEGKIKRIGSNKTGYWEVF